MKKNLLLSALLIPTLCAANTDSNTRTTGIYIGAGVGGSVLTGKQSAVISKLNQGTYNFNSHGLRDNALTGEVYVGWGKSWGAYYLGIEALYSFLNASSEFKTIVGGTGEEILTTKLKEAYGAALKVGYSIQPNILAYVRLGWESRRISVNFRDIDGAFVSLNKGYRSNAFVPGMGAEFKLTNQVFFRLEIRSAFYPSKNAEANENTTDYTRVVTKPRLHTLLAGITYGF